jgi:hypothetical protein
VSLSPLPVTLSLGAGLSIAAPIALFPPAGRSITASAISHGSAVGASPKLAAKHSSLNPQPNRMARGLERPTHYSSSWHGRRKLATGSRTYLVEGQRHDSEPSAHVLAALWDGAAAAAPSCASRPPTWGVRNPQRSSWFPACVPSCCSTASAIPVSWACPPSPDSWNISCAPRSSPFPALETARSALELLYGPVLGIDLGKLPRPSRPGSWTR